MNGSGEAIGLQAADLGPAVFSAAPVDPRLWHARGIELCRSGQFREGVEALRQSVQLAPQSPQMRNNLAGVLGTLGKHTEAETELREAVRLKPDYAEAWGNLGVALEHLDRYEEAIDAMRQALGLEPNRWFLHAHLSNACRKAGRPEEAVDAARKAAALNANAAEAHNSLGAALAELCELPAAIEAYRRAVALRPDYPEAHHNLGTALLLAGDFEHGWPEYEWRRRLGNPVFRRPGYAWRGENPNGRVLLLYCEGGLGNVIQFARYVPLVAGLGARVVLECQVELLAILKDLPGVWQVVRPEDPKPGYDADCPLASLPGMLGTRVETVPACVPYLKVDAGLVARWGEVVQQVPGVRVGVCWKGSQQVGQLRGRSFDPHELGALSEIPGVSLVSLQQGEPPPKDLPIRTLPNLDPMTMRLEDAAAVIANLDLVISCDTSIAHLAGALGVRTWVALKFAACWRWMLNRDDSPWYPTMRLFRQDSTGKWAPVFELMARELGTTRRQFVDVPKLASLS